MPIKMFTVNNIKKPRHIIYLGFVSLSDLNYFLEFFKKSGILSSTGLTLLVGCVGF